MPAVDMVQRFDRWGGSVRYVLEKLDREDQSSLQTAIDSCQTDSINKFVGGSSADAAVSNRILHLRVQPDSLCTKTHMTWASPWVAEQLAFKLWRDERAALASFVSAAAGMGELGGLRGHLWEGLCHARYAAGGGFSCRDLQSPEAPPFLLEVAAARSRIVFEDWQSEQMRTCQAGTYCRPRRRNVAAIDAAVQPDVLLQITVGQDHPVNCAGLARAVAGMQQQDAIKLYFVVPPDRFRSFPAQAIMQGKGVQLLRQRVKQFAVEIPFDR